MWFRQDAADSKMWIFRCGVRRQKKGIGYSNLVSHFAQAHSLSKNNVSTYSKKSGKLYAWIRVITTAPFPFLTVTNKNIIPFLLMENIGYKTFIKDLHQLKTSFE